MLGLSTRLFVLSTSRDLIIFCFIAREQLWSAQCSIMTYGKLPSNERLPIIPDQFYPQHVLTMYPPSNHPNAQFPVSIFNICIPNPKGPNEKKEVNLNEKTATIFVSPWILISLFHKCFREKKIKKIIAIMTA